MAGKDEKNKYIVIAAFCFASVVVPALAMLVGVPCFFGIMDPKQDPMVNGLLAFACLGIGPLLGVFVFVWGVEGDSPADVLRQHPLYDWLMRRKRDGRRDR